VERKPERGPKTQVNKAVSRFTHRPFRSTPDTTTSRNPDFLQPAGTDFWGRTDSPVDLRLVHRRSTRTAPLRIAPNLVPLLGSNFSIFYSGRQRGGCSMKTIGTTHFASISEAKATLPKLIEEEQPTVLLRHNQPVAALVSIEKYNEYLALEALVRDPALFERFRERAREAHRTPLDLLRTMEDLQARVEEQLQPPSQGVSDRVAIEQS